MTPSRRDYRDSVIEEFADQLQVMYERAIDAEADRDSYRLLAQQLLHALHHVTVHRDLLRDQGVLDRPLNRRRDRKHRRAA